MSALLSFIHTASLAVHSGHLPPLGSWTYLLISVLVAFEGPLTTLVASAAAAAGALKPALVFLFAAGGNLTSDAVWYSLGRAGKLDWFKRHGRKPGLTTEMLDWVRHGMNRHAFKIMFFGKLTMSFMIPILLTGGLSKVPWRRWFPGVLAGEVIWTGSLVLIGYFATEAIQRVASSIGYITLGLSLVFVVAVLWTGRRMLMKYFHQTNGNIEAG